LEILDCGILDFGLRIADCGFEVSLAQRRRLRRVSLYPFENKKRQNTLNPKSEI